MITSNWWVYWMRISCLSRYSVWDGSCCSVNPGPGMELLLSFTALLPCVFPTTHLFAIHFNIVFIINTECSVTMFHSYFDSFSPARTTPSAQHSGATDLPWRTKYSVIITSNSLLGTYTSPEHMITDFISQGDLYSVKINKVGWEQDIYTRACRWRSKRQVPRSECKIRLNARILPP